MGQVHSLAPDGHWSEIWVPATWTKEQPSKLVSRVENRKRKSVWLCIKVAATFWVSMEVQTPLNNGWRASNSWPCLSLTDSVQSGPAGHNFLIDIVQEVDWSRQCPCSIKFLQFSSVQFSRSAVSNSLQPHESQHARPPCPSQTPGVHPDSHPSSQWCHMPCRDDVFLSALQSLVQLLLIDCSFCLYYWVGDPLQMRR